MPVITTDSFTFEVPPAGEHFAESGRFVWHDARHELIVNVTTASAPLLPAIEANAHGAIEATLQKAELNVVGRTNPETAASLPCSSVTASPKDRSSLFTQGVIRGASAVMFATLESFSFEPSHAQLWSTFVRSVRAAVAPN
jgi:hypothetical protein